MIRSVSGTNTNISITLVGAVNLRHHIDQITWSYASAPTGGRCVTTGLQGDELDFDITAGGPGGLALPQSSYGGVGSDVTVTLSAGGGGIAGKLNVFSELE